MSVAIWRWFSPEWRPYGYAALDMGLALFFLAQSRGRLFPVPLFFLHAGLVAYHGYAALIAAPTPWVSAFINRAFELAMAYVMGCALFRLIRRARKSPQDMKKARRGRARLLVAR